jgi:hypothetical protein
MDRTQDSILYIETDIPPRMTCDDYRRAKAQQSSRRRIIGRFRARRAAKTR